MNTTSNAALDNLISTTQNVFDRMRLSSNAPKPQLNESENYTLSNLLRDHLNDPASLRLKTTSSPHNKNYFNTCLKLMHHYALAEEKAVMQLSKPKMPGEALNTWLQNIGTTVTAIEKRVMINLYCLEKNIKINDYKPPTTKSKAQPSVTAVTKRVSKLKSTLGTLFDFDPLATANYY